MSCSVMLCAMCGAVSCRCASCNVLPPSLLLLGSLSALSSNLKLPIMSSQSQKAAATMENVTNLEDEPGDDNPLSTQWTAARWHTPSAHWTSASDNTMVSILERNKSQGHQADSGWKPGVWNEVANAVRGGPRGPKTVKSCQDCWCMLVKEYNDICWLITTVLNMSEISNIIDVVRIVDADEVVEDTECMDDPCSCCLSIFWGNHHKSEAALD
ncbi:hypothetical protein C8Q77DRAFT_1074848 [Trametes polyzona]|nr:hypothetical protein C8Q77DRAFT_1074848 [Trametes polyzona]